MIDKKELLESIAEMIADNHNKIEARMVTKETVHRLEGYLEALYQVENLILNWGGEACIEMKGKIIFQV